MVITIDSKRCCTRAPKCFSYAIKLDSINELFKFYDSKLLERKEQYVFRLFIQAFKTTKI